MKARFLSNNETKKLKEIIRKNYTCKLPDFVFFETSKEKIWVCNEYVKQFLKFLPNVKFFGVFFGKLKRNKKIQLSLEGSQIVGKNATKNIIEFLNLSDLEKYIKEGKIPQKIRRNAEVHNFPIVKFNNYFAGSICLISENEIKSFFPKSRVKMIE